MNARITPRGQPHRTDLYGGVQSVYSDGMTLFLLHRPDRTALVDVLRLELPVTALPLAAVAAIALDDDPGDWW